MAQANRPFNARWAIMNTGHVLVDELDTRTDANAVRSKIGVLPDAQGIYPRLTARKNIQYFELYLMKPAEIEAQDQFLVEELGMHDFIDRRTAGFSQGQRMKVAIARAIVHNPVNVLLDEPTNGLDVMSTRAMRDVIRNMKANGQCVIFSSHLMQEVVALCDEVFIIADGMIVESGSIDSLLTDLTLDSKMSLFRLSISKPQRSHDSHQSHI